MEKTVILIAVIWFVIVVACVITGVWERIARMWQFYVFGGIVFGYLILAAALTDGGRQPMGWRGWAIIIFVTISWVAVTVCVILIRKLVKCSPWYLADLQERYKLLEADYIRLKADYGALQGRADMTAESLSYIAERHPGDNTYSVVDSNGKFTSSDGMTREEKQRKAAELYANGWNRNEIAEELGIAPSTAANYISAGNRLANTNYLNPQKPVYGKNQRKNVREQRKRGLAERAKQDGSQEQNESAQVGE